MKKNHYYIFLMCLSLSVATTGRQVGYLGISDSIHVDRMETPLWESVTSESLPVSVKQ